MAEQINNGGPAFPIVGTHEQVLEIGMTLRDYFAAKWLQGWMANPSSGDAGRDDAAKLAYAMADAMLRAREGGAACPPTEQGEP